MFSGLAIAGLLGVLIRWIMRSVQDPPQEPDA
jgi:hypothetical protein